MRTLAMCLWIAAAFAALLAVPAHAASGIFRNGEITIDTVVSTAPPQCEVLGTNLPAVFSGTMTGLFGKQPVEVDVYFGAGALSNESFACQSGEVSICTPAGNPLGLLILSDLSVCQPQKVSQPNDVIGAWQLAQVTDPSISDAWGMVTGTDAHPENFDRNAQAKPEGDRRKCQLTFEFERAAAWEAKGLEPYWRADLREAVLTVPHLTATAVRRCGGRRLTAARLESCGISVECSVQLERCG